MKRSFFLFLLITLSATAMAQINELGIYAGGANYIGDIGPTTYIAPDDVSLGVVYKWNRSPRHAYRASFMYGKISSTDAESDESGRKQRGYSFENTVKEVSLGLEFSFFDFNLHEPDFKLTPYVYSGLSYFWYDESYINSSGMQVKGDGKGALAIPMTVGLKAHIAPKFILAFEVGARYTFTDNLDGSSPENQSLAFGDLDSNDWYVFTGFTLTYTFGNKPCYCSE